LRYVTGILIVLAAIFIMGGLGAIMGLTTDFRTDTVSQNYTLSTNTTSTNGTVQLSSTLWEALITNASVSSNTTSDAPVISSYTDASKSLFIDGLASNTTRNITVEYKKAALSDYTGAEAGVKFFPVAIVIGCVFTALLSVVFIVLGR